MLRSASPYTAIGMSLSDRRRPKALFSGRKMEPLLDVNMARRRRSGRGDSGRSSGDSDPDDEGIVYAIETVTGLRGTLADAFGVYASPVIGAFLSRIIPSGTGSPRARRDPDRGADSGLIWPRLPERGGTCTAAAVPLNSWGSSQARWRHE